MDSMNLTSLTSEKDHKVIVVTGANKGIGKAIVKNLVLQAKNFGSEKTQKLIIYATSRDKNLGEKAVDDLTAELSGALVEFSIRNRVLDITSCSSIKEFISFLKETHEGVDIFINNAGIAIREEPIDFSTVETILETNFYSTLNAVEAVLPLMKLNGRVINLSSNLGKLSQFNVKLQKMFLARDLTTQKLKDLIEKAAIMLKESPSCFGDIWWAKSGYGLSKAGITALSKILMSEQLTEPNGKKLFIVSCSPGYVNTDMTQGQGELTVDQGADTAVYLSLAKIGEITGAYTTDEFYDGKGSLWFERKPIQW